MIMRSLTFRTILLAAILLQTALFAKGQTSTRMYRIAKIKVDSAHLEEYKVALHEQMNAAIELEPGVLSYTAVADKKDPTSITILEVYADTAAYQSHVLALHFKKYKETVKDWVLKLELIDTELVVSAKKDGF